MLTMLPFPAQSTAFVEGSAQAASGAVQTSAWLLVAIPLLSAGILLVLGRRSDRWGHWLGLLASVATFVLGASLLVSLLGYPAADRVRDLELFDWISTSDLSLAAGRIEAARAEARRALDAGWTGASAASLVWAVGRTGCSTCWSSSPRTSARRC